MGTPSREDPWLRYRPDRDRSGRARDGLEPGEHGTGEDRVEPAFGLGEVEADPDDAPPRPTRLPRRRTRAAAPAPTRPTDLDEVRRELASLADERHEDAETAVRAARALMDTFEILESERRFAEGERDREIRDIRLMVGRLVDLIDDPVEGERRRRDRVRLPADRRSILQRTREGFRRTAIAAGGATALGVAAALLIAAGVIDRGAAALSGLDTGRVAAGLVLIGLAYAVPNLAIRAIGWIVAGFRAGPAPRPAGTGRDLRRADVAEPFAPSPDRYDPDPPGRFERHAGEPPSGARQDRDRRGRLRD